MTFDELRARAAERGHVRWLKSGLIERLKLTKDGGAIYAYSKVTDFHFLVRKPKSDLPWTCEPCEKPTAEMMPAQLDAARSSRWFKGRDA